MYDYGWSEFYGILSTQVQQVVAILCLREFKVY